ncbi:MAG: MaoC family dehydratase [Desulfamplus sp.]|nr:MaoC family dehydratase [Desulfamplus sp.]
MSDWKEITQKQIDQFAEATGDHQWIHVDAKRAARGPFGKTIAHGFLTLSCISYFSFQGTLVPEGSKMITNYGLNRVRFINPVSVGSRIRDRIVLLDVKEQKEGRILVTTTHTIEIEGETKPACVAEFIAMIFV